jgi:hypothetical protein
MLSMAKFLMAMDRCRTVELLFGVCFIIGPGRLRNYLIVNTWSWPTRKTTRRKASLVTNPGNAPTTVENRQRTCRIGHLLPAQ